MARIARAWAALLLVIIGLGVAGCIHTWTQTYDDFPPIGLESLHQHQGNPGDG